MIKLIVDYIETPVIKITFAALIAQKKGEELAQHIKSEDLLPVVDHR